MRAAKVTGSLPWPTVVDGSHECACQDLVKKVAPAEMATSGRSLFLISISCSISTSIGRHLESAGKEGKKKMNNQIRMSALPDSVQFVLFRGHFGGPAGCPSLHRLHTPELFTFVDFIYKR